ncbi:MAG: phospholipase D family protein [Rhodobacteraceae bacterium]|nr:phospholipase D family protein [Natronohydrobacter sp.]MCC6009250.1 phospholipase D family protein [Paracoccaceae bacterium]
MCEFLAGDDLSRKIKEVVRRANARCAVAFWGRDAVRELFGTEYLERDDVWILCDITMGGTNPETLRKIVESRAENHGHVPGLHAKIYHSDGGMVVGSANASGNGIGFRGKPPKQIESGTYHERNSGSWEYAQNWFDALWNDAGDLDEAAIRIAERTWGENKNSRLGLNRELIASSLLELQRLSGEVKLVLCYGEYSDKDVQEYTETAVDLDLDPNDENLDPFESEGYEPNKWPKNFICLELDGRAINFTFHRRGVGDENWHYPESLSWREYLSDLGHPNATIPEPFTVRTERPQEYKELADENRFFTVDNVLPLLR